MSKAVPVSEMVKNREGEGFCWRGRDYKYTVQCLTYSIPDTNKSQIYCLVDTSLKLRDEI